MSGGYDDELTRPLEGALEASTSEGASSPAGRPGRVGRPPRRQPRGRGGRLGSLEERLRDVPWWAWLTAFVALFCLVPLVSDSGYVRRVAFDIAIYMLLALGLNVVVGWGGLLDLGFVAFFGVGAYAYALLSSEHYGVHLPTISRSRSDRCDRSRRRLPRGPAVAATDRGLPRDRDPVLPPALPDGDDERRRPLRPQRHGWRERDPERRSAQPLRARAPRRRTTGIFNVAYLYVVLAVFVVVYVALRFVNLSRTGRAWRSLREDPLAAEVMGMPVNALKLMSFAFGAVHRSSHRHARLIA